MELLFLGTSAAEGVPAIFCDCPICAAARRTGGKNIRTRSQILINGDTLLDFPPDAYLHAVKNSLDFSKIKNLFITHSHSDHCAPNDLALRREPFSYNQSEPVLTLHGNKTVIKKVSSALHFKNVSIVFNTLKPYDKTDVLSDGKTLTVTALPAAHFDSLLEKTESCLIFLIEDGDKTFFMFHDSGILDDGVYEYLKAQNKKIDAVAFDCTYGYTSKGKGRHMGYFDAVNERDRMESFGILNDGCKFILTHFSHNTKLLYDDMQQKVAGEGFIAAYDGIKIIL